MQKKVIILILVILISFTSTISVGCGRNVDTTFYFPDSNKIGNLKDVTLTIYYMSFDVFVSSPMPLIYLTGGWYNEQIGQTMRGMYDRRIVVSGRRLSAHHDLINQLFSTELNPTGNKVATGERALYLLNQRLFATELYQIENEIIIDARLYYVFQHKEYGEIFSILVSCGFGSGILANGVAVEHDNIFFEAILPFLPNRIARDIRGFIRPK